jgi:hypothetical protein
MADRDEDNDDDRNSEPPESTARSKGDRDEEEAADEAPRPKKKLAKNTRKGAKADERKPKPSERAKEREKEREKYRAKEPESSSSSLIWIGLVAAVALGAWWILRGQGSNDTKESAPARSETPTVETPPTKPEAPAAKTEEPAPPPEAPAPSASATPEPSAAPPTPPTSAGGGTFDKGVALDALAKSGAKAAGCRMRGESGGTANVTVTFEPSGKVKEAEIRSGAYSGSPTGKCIIRKLMETTIPAFSGDAGQVIAPVSVR